jgi:hypothetical protein
MAPVGGKKPQILRYAQNDNGKQMQVPFGKLRAGSRLRLALTRQTSPQDDIKSKRQQQVPFGCAQSRLSLRTACFVQDDTNGKQQVLSSRDALTQDDIKK